MRVLMLIGLCLLTGIVGYITGFWRSGNKCVKLLDKANRKATKYERYARLYDIWMMTKKYGASVEKYLLQRNIHTIAIYGMDLLGIRLYHELKETGIEVLYGMDRDPEFQTPGLTIYTEWDAEQRSVDAVVVADFLSYRSIEPKLIDAGYQNVMAIDELLYQLI